MIIGNYIESKQYQKIIVSLKDVNTEEDLFKTFYQQLNFPKYFGFNWNALDECLSQPSFEVNSDIMYIITDCKSCLKNFGNKLIGFFNRLVECGIEDLDTNKHYNCVVQIEEYSNKGRKMIEKRGLLWYNESMNYMERMKEKFLALKDKKDVLILSIESSCDETSVAIVKNGRDVLANVITTQIPIHRRFGGVVPEVASRNHILAISNIFEEALKSANLKKEDIDAIAVTYGAGLIGALLVGVNFAKGLAYSLDKPLIAVSHVQGHISANYISHKTLKPPFVCLMISGGHSALLNVEDYNKFSFLGSTLDDAVGEAFDKVARVLSLPYPGGPEIDKLAKEGERVYDFTVSKSLKNTLNFSFSGIKTEVVNLVHNATQKGIELNKPDVACSFQEAVTDELVEKSLKACRMTGIKKLVVAGGVGANSCLRAKLDKMGEENNIECFYPVLTYCTDNAAMIGSMAYYMIKDGLGLADLDLTAKANVELK